MAEMKIKPNLLILKVQSLCRPFFSNQLNYFHDKLFYDFLARSLLDKNKTFLSPIFSILGSSVFDQNTIHFAVTHWTFFLYCLIFCNNIATGPCVLFWSKLVLAPSFGCYLKHSAWNYSMNSPNEYFECKENFP